jgi:hypothetical protein
MFGRFDDAAARAIRAQAGDVVEDDWLAEVTWSQDQVA